MKSSRWIWMKGFSTAAKCVLFMVTTTWKLSELAKQKYLYYITRYVLFFRYKWVHGGKRWVQWWHTRLQKRGWVVSLWLQDWLWAHSGRGWLPRYALLGTHCVHGPFLGLTRLWINGFVIRQEMVCEGKMPYEWIVLKRTRHEVPLFWKHVHGYLRVDRWSFHWRSSSSHCMCKLLSQFGYIFLAATKQLYEWFSPSVCLCSVRLSVCQSVCVRPSVCPSVCHTFLTMFPLSLLPTTKGTSMLFWSRSEVKGQGHRGQHSI